MGICSACAKIWLVLVNLIIFLIGALFITAGIIIEVGLEVVKQAYNQVLSKAPELVRDSKWVNYSDKIFQKGEDLQLDVVLGPAAIAFFVTGAILILISIFGCCGACCHNTCMLATYSAILIFIILLEVVLVILLFAAGTKFENEAKDVMKKSIRDKFEGISGSNVINLMWNFAQLYFKCCGTENSDDFQAAIHWTRHIQVNASGGVENVTLQVPLSCCKMNGTFPDVVPQDSKCSYSATDVNSYKNKGCYSRLIEWVQEQSRYLIIAGVILLVIELIIVILSVALLCMKRKDHDDDDIDYKPRGA